MRARTLGLLAVTLLIGWGCAGEGTGLDPFGNPLDPGGGGPPPLAPTLTAIQANVFTAICIQCHTGAASPLGLALDEGVSRDNLVGVASVELPAVLRVDPGNPDDSYIVWKIEGRAGIAGARMPLGLPPLTTEQIDAIRGWIQAGAPDN
ncbi:MAG: hypothetical protein ACE5FP_06005 [Gemmatimonadota bacterium]